MTTVSTNDPDGKIAKENAERKAQEVKQERETLVEKLQESREERESNESDQLDKTENQDSSYISKTVLINSFKSL